MPARGSAAPSREPIWLRLARSPRPQPLSIDRIVHAAMELADREGLEAITIRRLAAAVHASPMALYRYVASKDDVFELLVDAAYAEMVLPEHVRGQWRQDLRAAAIAIRATVNKHPWLPSLLAAGPSIGPHALLHSEFCLAALDGLGLDITTMMSIAGMVTGFSVSFAASESAETELNQRSGTSEEDRRAAAGPYIEREVLASGRFPFLARWVMEGLDSDSDELFDLGLDCVMDGIEARLMRRRVGTDTV